MRLKYVYLTTGAGLIIALAGWLIFRSQLNQPIAPLVQPSSHIQPENRPVLGESKTRTIKASQISGVAEVFKFQAAILKDWQGEAVQAIEAINIYDPSTQGNGNLEKSQIFIRYFQANNFLTLSTVNILERSETQMDGRPAVKYVIEKKEGVANFANQPFWRSQKHVVTDVRISDESPSVFYVIAKRPDLDDKIYDDFIASFKIVADGSALIEPVQEFKSRIIKKPFGIFITPQNSPVRPERFTGYHTGVDVEFDDIAVDVPVKAIADGQVLAFETVDGYGGVMVLRHKIQSEYRAVVYGHLDPQSMLKTDTIVKAGDQIAILGDGFTSETDGERKHLHLSIFKTATIDRRGYIQKQAELENWLNPAELF